MPLLDHFHPPLSLERHWESFHAAWAGSLADALNRRLPGGYFAEEQAHPIDVLRPGDAPLAGGVRRGGADVARIARMTDRRRGRGGVDWRPMLRVPRSTSGSAIMCRRGDSRAVVMPMVLAVVGCSGDSSVLTDEDKAVAALEKLGAWTKRDEVKPGKPVVEVSLANKEVTDADLKGIRIRSHFSVCR